MTDLTCQASLTNATTAHNFTSDPFLEFKPQFAHSLPVQLLMTGVVLTLATTLLIQLCFTWQYHWPLARINWTLQFTAVCTLLINIVAIMFVTLTTLDAKSTQWPYMFDYVAIDVPRVGFWSIPEIAAWYVMEACTSALASVSCLKNRFHHNCLRPVSDHSHTVPNIPIPLQTRSAPRFPSSWTTRHCCKHYDTPTNICIFFLLS